ncbi:MAG: phenylacetate--CoA ligase [Deltaproteobacteria bacterium]|nr:phenylacetate--CoA ligase [Deltaproteobacteria bacterium]
MKKRTLHPRILDEKAECMPRAELEELQLARLKRSLEHCYRRVPFFRNKWDKERFHPEAFNSLSDLRKLPFTTKEDLRKNYPFGLFALPMDQIVGLHSSTGTTGKPTLVAYSRNDLNNWADLIARELAASGLEPGIIVQIAFGYGITTGGLGFHMGAARLGAAVLPTSNTLSPAHQLFELKELNVGMLLCTPSFATTIQEEAEKSGIDLKELPVAAAIMGGEAWTVELRERLERDWAFKAYDTYGLSEVIGPGVAHECQYQNGHHIYEDHFIAEVVDFETGELVAPGQTGELVLTSLTKEAVPVVRYRTRDCTRLVPGTCACGRSFQRIERVTGRIDESVILGKKRVYPSDIEHIVFRFNELSEYYQLVSEDKPMDRLKVIVESNESNISGYQMQLRELQKQVETSIRHELELDQVEVSIVPKYTLPRSVGKAERLFIQKP